MNKPLTARALAAKLVAEMMFWKHSWENCRAQIVQNPEQKLVNELVIGTLRNGLWLDHCLNSLLKKPSARLDPQVRALLLVGCYQLEMLRIPAHTVVDLTVSACQPIKRNWARGLVNKILRNYMGTQDTTLIKQQHSLPDWIKKPLQQKWPEHFAAIVSTLQQQAPLTLRINLRRTDRASYASSLQAAGIEFSLCQHASQGISLQSRVDISELPGYRQGLFSVQDESAQMAAPLLELKPGMRILDACAAPGGKTTHILELTEPSELFAVDCSRQRLTRFSTNLQRLHDDRSGAVQTLVADVEDLSGWWDGELFDRILIDPPCSATGTLRRHPDILYLKSNKDICSYVNRQLEILRSLWKCLAPGGILLYTTCSLLADENESCIRTFMTENNNAALIPVILPQGITHNDCSTILPGVKGGSDGFFFARLTKTAPSPTPSSENSAV